MSNERKPGGCLLTIVGIGWAVLSPVCLGLSLFFIAFYDSPLDPRAGMGLLDYILILSVLAFPVLCAIASLGIWILNKRSRGAATLAALLPTLALVPIIAIVGWANADAGDRGGPGTPAAACGAEVVDGGDGLPTTACGTLHAGVTGTGTLATTEEAHNWEFSTESGVLRITLKNDGQSCPHVRVLDARGQLADGFEDENNLRLCPTDMITTGFFEFQPARPGTYTLRVFSPEAPGAYWVSIE